MCKISVCLCIVFQQPYYCRMLNVQEYFKLVIRVRMMFVVFKFGECHVMRSFFVCKHYI